MGQIIELELSPDRVVEIEVEGTPLAPGDFRDLSSKGWEGGRVRRKLSDIADDFRDIMSGIADRLTDAGPGKPEKTTVEMSVDLGTGGLIKFLSADTKGGIKITMTWGK